MSKKGSNICGGIFDLDVKQKKVETLDKRMEEPDFWENQDQAQKIIQECNLLKAWTRPANEIKTRVENISAILPEAIALEDDELLEELTKELDDVQEILGELEIRKMLSGELDNKNCYLEINAGAGGTESCDWVSMLARMYERWASKRGWQVELIDRLEGEIAGIKSITYKFIGNFAYGYSKSEKGVHRLVRISPFDSSNKRHTSFASVDVTPEITEDIQIIIRPEEVRIDTFRSSGAGGQHVNVTDSAVRITHLPTRIVVSCQSERSQTQNKETCFKMLRSKLYEKEVMEREEALKQHGGEKKKIEFGSQIRNYTFQPYTLVKDTRTKVEETNVEAVMDGNIDPFIYAFLKEFGGR